MKKKKGYFHDYHKEQIGYAAIDWELVKRLSSYLKPYRFWLMVAVLFLLISRIIEAIVPIFIGYTTQQILSARGGEDNQELLSWIIQMCLGIIGLLSVSYLLDVGTVFLKNWVGQRALYFLRTKVFKHILSMPMKFFDRQSVGRLMSRTIHDIDQIDQMFSESLVHIIGGLMLFASMLVGILYVDLRVGLIICACLPLVWLLGRHFRINQRRCYDLIRRIVSSMNSFIQEYLMGSPTIRSFGLQKYERKKFEEINADFRTANMESMHYFAFFLAGIDFLQSFLLIAIFAVLIYLDPVTFQAGKFFTYSLYALMFFRPLGDLAERYNVMQSAMAAAERVFDILEQPVEKEAVENPKTLHEIHEIVFRDVWFAYEKEHWILKGLSFHLKKGESIAVVGVTGAGKTTIMNLLQRLYNFQRGSITINGQDIREYSLESLRKQFSLVLQDPVIFSGTIADNISLFDLSISTDKIQQAIEYVSFQEGIHHKLQERGTNLSAGERQLISFARAVAYDRPVLLLDEATANIDAGTERAIQETLSKILKTKTSIIIAHRLSTIKNVSKILVLHQGIVKEFGTHDELLKLGGIYEKLYRLQFTNGNIKTR